MDTVSQSVVAVQKTWRSFAKATTIYWSFYNPPDIFGLKQMHNQAPTLFTKPISSGVRITLYPTLAANRLSSELTQNESKYNVEATNNIYLPGGKRVRGFVGIEVLARNSY